MTSIEELKNVAIGGMSITICTLVLMLAVVSFTIDTGQPARLFFPKMFDAAYGQQATGPSQDIEVINSETVREQVFDFIGGTRLINYTLFENGSAIYVFEYARPSLQGNSTTPNPIESNILEVHTTHGFTPANG